MKQITIDDLIPLLKKGWVAMDEDGMWCWYSKKPHITYNLQCEVEWYAKNSSVSVLPDCFDLRKERYSEESLRRVK